MLLIIYSSSTTPSPSSWSKGALHIYTKMIFNRKALLFVTCSAGVFFRAAAAAAEGKSTKGTKSQSNPVPLYFLNPSSCPQDCVQCGWGLAAGASPIEGHGTGEAVQPCDAENIHQMWRFHQKDGLTMIESEYNPGDCLAVVPPQESDAGLGAILSVMAAGAAADFDMLRVGSFEELDITQTMDIIVMGAIGDGWVVDDMCQHGSVGLLSCNNPASQWLFSGGNLISAVCFKNGISSFMAVNEECSELSVVAADGGNDALLRSQTFMLTEQDFIETIIPASTDEGKPGDSDQSFGGPIPTQFGGMPGYVGATVGVTIVPASNDGGDSSSSYQSLVGSIYPIV